MNCSRIGGHNSELKPFFISSQSIKREYNRVTSVGVEPQLAASAEDFDTHLPANPMSIAVAEPATKIPSKDYQNQKWKWFRARIRSSSPFVRSNKTFYKK